MKRRGLSLRTKILMLLTAIPVVTLGAYLVLALKTFESDKIAYVFDSTSSMAGTVAAQVKTQLGSVLLQCKPMFQDYLTNASHGDPKHFSAQGDSLFRQEPTIDDLVVYQARPGGGLETMALLEKEPGDYARRIEPMKNEVAGVFARAITDGRIVKQLSANDDRLLILDKFQNDQVTLIFAVIRRVPEVADLFGASSSQRLYLIDGPGKILFGPPDERGRNLGELLKLSFLSDPTRATAQGAETAKDQNGAAVLASFARIGFGDLVVVASVSREKALSAMGVLLRKSVIFFILLICVTVIVSMIASGQITRALSSLFAATERVSKGQFDIRVEVSSSDEVGALAENFNIMAAEVSRLLEATAEKARMESELQTARTVQETLFPQAHSRMGGLDIAGFYEPASECGGDWWHYGESGSRVLMWIGDATGHGAPAALITSAAKSAATIIESMNVTPAIAMGYLNRAICEVSRGRIMMTFFLASYDSKTKLLTYTNASHESPFLIRKSSGPLKKKDLIPFNEVNSPRLGQSKDTIYQETTVQIEEGDLIFFYTDGLPDVRSPANESWGEREFIKTMVSVHQDFPMPTEAVRRFTEIFQGFRQGAQLADDVTFFYRKKRSERYNLISNFSRG